MANSQEDSLYAPNSNDNPTYITKCVVSFIIPFKNPPIVSQCDSKT